MVTEWCPHCEIEVELEDELKKQVCPECFEDILPCALCDPDVVDCNKCPIEDDAPVSLSEYLKDKIYHDYEFVGAIDELELTRAQKLNVIKVIDKCFQFP